MGPRIELSEAIAEVFITDALLQRTPPDPDYLREKLALQDLANQMSDHPSEVLPRLVKLAMDICGAESAGISILEPETAQFRWYALSGVLATFEGATTPRNFSPCGVCLDTDGPVLMERPERAYDWIRDANISVPEVLLVPLKVKGLQSVGTLWIVANQTTHFHIGHARVVSELAAFAGMALRMIQTEERLKLALEQQETVTREMSHRVKNLFAIIDSMIRMTASNAATKEEFAISLSGRLHALASANALVRRTFVDEVDEGAGFAELIERILRPYDHTRSVVEGPEFQVGQNATNSLALVFHELATNAAKYGALSLETGSVSVKWLIHEDLIRLVWTEVDGPTASTPVSFGFGSRLVGATVKRLGGTIEYEWRPSGLVSHVTLPIRTLRA